MAGLSPTQRTLKAMREQGRLCGIVERFNQYAGPHGIRQDLFGFIDILCLDPADGIIGVQSCGQDYAGHVRKLTEERNEAVFEWLKHARAELWGWRKIKLRRGGKAMRWRPRIGDIVLDGEDVRIVERKGA